MATLAVSALYLLILMWASWGYLRRRDPLLREVMLIFASVAVLFVLGVVRLVAGEPPRVVAGLFSALLLGQPFFTLRLVSRMRPVPRWIMGAVLAGWMLSSVPVVVLERPVPRLVVWSVVGVFFAAEAVAAWLLAAEARHRGGAARIRLWCAAVGTALFGVVLVVAGGGTPVAVSRTVAVVSALMYMLAFLPPRWLRRAWSRGPAYAVMRQLLAAPVDEPPQHTWRRYCQGGREVLGADEVVVVLPTTPGTVELVTQSGLSLGGQRYGDSDLGQLLAGGATIDALAGRTRLPEIAADLAQASETRFVTAAPLTAGGRRGALVLLNRYRSLFTDDDVALFAELASHAAALAERSAVLAERQHLAVIVESSHDAIIGKTLDGVITIWNPGAEQLYSYTAEEVIGRNAELLFDPEHRAREAEILARIARGERTEQYQIERIRKDGTPVTVSLTASPITGSTGEIVGVATVSRDISEKQRAEAKFRGLLEAAPDAIVGVGPDGRIALVNAQTERLFGYPREELAGQPMEILVPEGARAVHPAHRHRYFTNSESRPTGAKELSARRKDGTEFPVEVSLSSLETEDGTLVIAAIRDVTERIEAQAERERLIAQTERDAAERRLQHSRRLESLGQLAGGVAHDFNNILGVLTSYTELVLDTLDTPAPTSADLAAVRADLAQIRRATERAARLTQQLLAFGRRDITQTEVLSLNHVISDVEPMLRRTIGEHIHLITHPDRELRPVLADPSQLEQILLNLAVNARDAMPTGGTLSIDTANTDLDQADVAGSVLTPGQYVRLRVSDTGSGMPPDVAERAFEPFYTTKPQGVGTGLGLATVYGIAAAAGGDVRLYSEPGIGTTVTIVLPVTQATSGENGATAASGPAQVPAESQPHETILLVEDEDALRDVSSRILTRAGYHVLTANGGAAAIHLAHTHPGPIHLLLTDVIMPEMMGNELAARIHTSRPDTPALYMSGYAQPVLTENGNLKAGVTLIEKPFTRRELLDRIRTVLDHTERPHDATPAPGPGTQAHQVSTRAPANAGIRSTAPQGPK
jgi:PAS domain S-box-containing protein